MARLIVRIAPNAHPTDSTLTPLRTQPGDVVQIVDDGHVFSLCERTNGQYRIIDVPALTQEQLIHLVAARISINPVTGEETTLRIRNVALDPAALSAGVWRTRTSATKNQIDAITITKP